MHNIGNQITNVCEKKKTKILRLCHFLSEFLFRCHTYDYLNVNCHLIFIPSHILSNLHYSAVWFPWRLCCIIYIISGIGGCCWETVGKSFNENKFNGMLVRRQFDWIKWSWIFNLIWSKALTWRKTNLLFWLMQRFDFNESNALDWMKAIL